MLTCLVVLAACAVALRTALHWLPRSGVYARQIPLTIEAGAAAVIGVTTRSPFGEPERATGRWLPWLRLAASVALTGDRRRGTGGRGRGAPTWPAAPLGLLRDTAGLHRHRPADRGGAGRRPGLDRPDGLPGGHAARADRASWTTPWIWPARPPHDRGAAICAALVFAAGVAVITARGARDRSRDWPDRITIRRAWSR